MTHEDSPLDRHRLAGAFGAVAATYDRGRPGYPDDAVRWLVGRDAASVLELGAGTGLLTSRLVSQGHDVFATDPSHEMLAVCAQRVPGARCSVGGAEDIDAADRSFDVVVAAQSFHWFDHERALPEIARVLRPGGHLALVWNTFDMRIPWVKRLSALLGGQQVEAVREATGTHALLEASPLFGEVEEQAFKQWQHINRSSVLDLAGSRSYVASLPAEEREARLDAVLAFYDDYGRGMDGMELPYDVNCYRAPVTAVAARLTEPTVPIAGHDDGDRPAPPPPTGGPDDPDDLLLIDFR